MKTKLKNTTIQLKITDIQPDGNGVGRTPEGIVVFVPLTAPGDVCEVLIIKETRGYLIGKLLRIITPSPDRVTPDCEVFNTCGGCTFRHMSYDSEKRIKHSIVDNAFSRIAGMQVPVMQLLSVNQDKYRNKVIYPIGQDMAGGLEFGFYARRSHRIVPHDICLLQEDIFAGIAKDFVKLCQDNKIPGYDEAKGTGVLRHLQLRKTSTDEVSVCVVINAQELPKADIIVKALTEKYPEIKSFVININIKRGNTVLGDKTNVIWGDPFITEELMGKRFRLSATSFFQVNTKGAEILYKKASEYAQLSPGEILLDLYCGTGAIGICIAGEDNPLCGVEIVKDAVINAKENALLNGRSEENTLFLQGDAKDGIKECKKHFGSPDVVVVDPPRKGLNNELIGNIVEAEPKRVVYISCNPATLARDVAVFVQSGFEVREVTPVDLFPRTGHVECVALMSRIEN